MTQVMGLMRKGVGQRSAVQNALFVVSRSDMYIVSIQQTVHSALLRGFEPCSATVSLCTSAIAQRACFFVHNSVLSKL